MKTIMLLVTLGLTNFAFPTWAVEPAAHHDMTKMHKNLSKEDREKMAMAHAQMATCLRSDQDFKVCHETLHKECQSMMGGSCTGMDMGKDIHKGKTHKK